MEPKPNLLHAVRTLSMAGAAFLACVLMIFLGAITQRFPVAGLIEPLRAAWTEQITLSRWTWFLLSGDRNSFSNSVTPVDGVVLSVIAVSLLLVVAGVAAADKQVNAAEPAAGDPQQSAWLVALTNASAAFTVAALAATLLELVGLWKRLVLNPDPLMEKGAPVWVWWILLLISFLLWFAPGRRRLQVVGGRVLIRRTSIVTLAGLVALLIATFLFVIREYPVQGRYYGIPGFTVGRQYSNEYGTYYGVTGGGAASILGFSAMIGILYRAGKLRSTG
jgi:hypothetical protein